MVALDGPSGVDLSDGAVAGEAVRAAATITFGAPKRGLLLFPGRAHAGRLLVVEVGFPPLRRGGVRRPRWSPPPGRAARLPRLPPDAHKGTAGTRGRCSPAAPGWRAPPSWPPRARCARARGWRRSSPPAANRVPRAGRAARGALRRPRRRRPCEALAGARTRVVAGPGMGTDEAAREAPARRCCATGDPRLLDADALTLLAREPGAAAPAARERILLTPHPGEMARLLGRGVAEVTADPFAAAARPRGALRLRRPPQGRALAGRRARPADARQRHRPLRRRHRRDGRHPGRRRGAPSSARAPRRATRRRWPSTSPAGRRSRRGGEGGSSRATWPRRSPRVARRAAGSRRSLRLPTSCWTCRRPADSAPRPVDSPRAAVHYVPPRITFLPSPNLRTGFRSR